MTYNSASSTLIHRLVRSKSTREKASLRPATDTDVRQEEDTSKAFRRPRRLFSKRSSRVSTRILSLAVVIQALVAVIWNRHCRDDEYGNIRLIFPKNGAPHHYYPITVQATGRHDFKQVIRLFRHNKPQHLIHNRENRYWMDRNQNRPKHPPVSPIPETCQEQDWMNDLHPTCLDIHEIDLTDFFFNTKRDIVSVDNSKRRKKMKFIGQGGFRNAIMFHEEATGTRRVLKTLVYDEENRDFTPRNYDKMRRDAVISEQLTASKYIADIFGFCGISTVVDYSNEKDLDSIYDKDPTKDELFEIAHDVAQSVADAHYLNEQGRATIVHMDIKPDQWIWLDGRYKLNDFNLARMILWDPVKQTSCHTATGYSGGRYQAPEQYTQERPRTEKIDVWSLGNVFGFLLTNENPFYKLSADSAKERIEEGEIWKIDDAKVLNSTHPFDVTVIQAREMCLQYEPNDRPSAQEVADFLRVALDEYNKSKKEK